MRTVDEVLASTSDVIFPAEIGRAKVSLDSRCCDGDTPLHVVAWRNDVEAAEVLIAAGADVNALGEMGETPLHVAVHNQNGRLARILLAAGARADIRGEFGTAREMAAKVPSLASSFENVK
jgi:uncharacterized protein